MELIFWVIVIMAVIALAQGEARTKRIKKAKEYSPPNVHGNSTWASDKELKRAGLVK